MDENKKSCDLCGLAVEVEGFKLKTVEGERRFCCEGCKGIYQMLHEANVLPDDTEDPGPTKS